MKSFITTIVVALVLSASTGTALARPAVDSGTAGSSPVSFEAPAPSPSGGGIATLTIVLLSAGGVAMLFAAGSAGAYVARHRPHTTSGV